MSRYNGCCHCGAIGFEYTTQKLPENWSVRACQCAFCRVHAALSTSDPSGLLSFTAADIDKLQRYRFAMKTADFLLCKHCGTYIGAVIETERGRFGIANTRALSDAHLESALTSPISYDNEEKQARVSRREQRWTPVVQVPWPL